MVYIRVDIRSFSSCKSIKITWDQPKIPHYSTVINCFGLTYSVSENSNKKVVESKELILTTEDVSRLTTIIADKLEGFLDIGNRQLLESSISAAIKEIVVE